MVQKKSRVRSILFRVLRHAALALALCSTVVGHANASSSLKISWNAPPDCPDQHAAESRVFALLGDEVIAASADIQVGHTGRGYRADVRLTSSAGSGTRQIESASCDGLLDSVALVLALGVSIEQPAPRLGVRWTLAAMGGIVSGPLPALAPGAGLSTAVEWPRLRIELHGSYHLPQRKPLDDTLSGQFRLVAAGARVGSQFIWGQLELAPSVGVELYYIGSEGRGGETSETGGTWSTGPALGLLNRVRITEHWAIAVVADGVAPLMRSRFVFSDAGVLHRPSAIALHLWLAVEGRL